MLIIFRPNKINALHAYGVCSSFPRTAERTSALRQERPFPEKSAFDPGWVKLSKSRADVRSYLECGSPRSPRNARLAAAGLNWFP
jgi:hypothetical protein